MLDKTDGAIDFTAAAAAVASRIRGVDPWPGASATLRGQPVKLFRAETAPATERTPAGTVIAIDKRGIHVGCGDGAVVVIAEVQAAGRKRMAAAQFAAGRGIAVGDVLT
jgi:methionyl-tRNA formyltransferase